MSGTKRVNLQLDRCTGCYACAVACIDQNYDIDEDYACFRHVLKMENPSKQRLGFASIGCMHCEDNPCVFACPTGAVSRDAETNLVSVDQSKCVGCHSCLLACPYGAPKFDAHNKMVKCNGCNDRVKAGLLPACVGTCPSKALSFTTDEELYQTRDRQLRSKLERE